MKEIMVFAARVGCPAVRELELLLTTALGLKAEQNNLIQAYIFAQKSQVDVFKFKIPKRFALYHNGKCCQTYTTERVRVRRRCSDCT